MSSEFMTENGSSGASPDGYHSFASYLKCPRKYALEKMGVRLNVTRIPAYFTLGTLMHAGRAAFLSLGSRTTTDTQAQVILAIQEAWNEEFERAEAQGKQVSDAALDMARGYMQEYMDHYSVRASPSILATEHLLSGEVTAPMGKVALSARLDDIGFYHEAGNALCIGECKTTSGRISDAVSEYTLHPQVLLQQYLYMHSPLAETYGKIRGTILDIIKKGYSGRASDFHREFIPYNEKLANKAALMLGVYKSTAEAISHTISVQHPNFGSCSARKADNTYACDYRSLCANGRDVMFDYTGTNDILFEDLYK